MRHGWLIAAALAAGTAARGEPMPQLAVVTAGGVPKIESPIVSFYAHRAAVGARR